MPLIPALGRQIQEDHYESETSLVHSEMSMIAKAAQRDPAERRGKKGRRRKSFFYITFPYIFGLLSLHICFSFVRWGVHKNPRT